MEFKDGVSIFVSDGQKVGHLHRVVIDPATKEITHIVAQQGFLLKEDKVIGVDKVLSATEDDVALNCTIEEVKVLPPLEIEVYEPLSEISSRGGAIDPLATGSYYLPERYVLKEIRRNIADELVALKEGARVMSKDYEYVGNVERLYTDADSGKVTHIVVSQGLLFKIKRAIPIQWVKMLDDHTVHLTINAEQLDILPAHSD